MSNKQKHETMEITIQSEMQRRLDLVNNEEFIKMSVEFCKKIGVTAKEWNENKAVILLKLANDFCSLENKIK